MILDYRSILHFLHTSILLLPRRTMDGFGDDPVCWLLHRHLLIL